MTPEIKILAVSNVYSRLMHFKKAGDQEQGHYHDYDHGTLLASGRLLVEKETSDGSVVVKEFIAPTFIMIEKGATHLLTALEDNTVATCIHALKTIDEEIVDSSFIVEETVFADSPEQDKDGVTNIGKYFTDKGMKYKELMRRTPPDTK
jgi:hypothetical protein